MNEGENHDRERVTLFRTLVFLDARAGSVRDSTSYSGEKGISPEKAAGIWDSVRRKRDH